MSKSGLLDSTATALPDANDLPSVREETGLTLRRLEVWIDEWRLRMRMMSACVEGCQEEGAQGGALVSLINGYTDHGDPFVREFTDQMLEEVCPFLIFTSTNWTTEIGLQTLLFDIAPLALLWRIARPLCRVLRLGELGPCTHSVLLSANCVLHTRRRRWVHGWG